MVAEPHLPKPEIRGIGKILYRCAECGKLMEPDQATIVDGRSYHSDHIADDPSAC